MLVGSAPASADTEMRQSYDPAYELANFNKTNERFAHLVALPDYQAQLRVKGAQREAEALQIIATDGPFREYGRVFEGQLCWQHMDGCAGDTRLYDWGANGYGTVQPILYTARNGSTISGHVWATKAGPAKRPGIVITNGSVQAPEELYWFAAQTLAKAGYVVMTWDPQGQGYSRHLRRRGRPAGRLPLADRTAVLRRHGGRARLLLLQPGLCLPPARLVQQRDRPLRQAGALAWRRAQLGVQPLRWRCSIPVSRGRRRTVARRRRGLLHRADRPARQGDRRDGQPLGADERPDLSVHARFRGRRTRSSPSPRSG